MNMNTQIEAVESDDEQSASGFQDFRGGGKDGGERFEFLVDRHADRLETAGGGMGFGQMTYE